MSDITYKRLDEVNEVNVPQINTLLRHLHGESLQHDVLSAADHLCKSIVVIAIKGNATIVGIAVLVPGYCWTHIDAEIRNVVVQKGFIESDEKNIVEGMLKLLTKIASETMFTEIRFRLRSGLQFCSEVIENLGFIVDSERFYRLKLHKDKKLR